MKKLIILAMICLLALTGCGGSDVEVLPFSYEEQMSNYGTPDFGVRDDFKNKTKKEIRNADDAVKRAKNELAADDEYNTVIVSYDETADIWCVSFFNDYIMGGGQNVYLNGDGITQRVIYGE